jgi:hypothetical protein
MEGKNEERVSNWIDLGFKFVIDLSSEAKSCSEQGNQYPFCYPTTTDVWKNGTTHDFIWNWK